LSNPTDDVLVPWIDDEDTFQQLLAGTYRPPPTTEEQDAIRVDQANHLLLCLGRDDLAAELLKTGPRDDPEHDDRKRIWRGTELLQNPDLLKIPEPISPILAYPERLTFLSGREKLSGKSTLASWDIAVASRSMPCLWITYEETLADIVRRLDGFGWNPSQTFIAERLSGPEILQEMKAHGTKYVVLDSWAGYVSTVHGKLPASHEGEEWQAVALQLKDLAFHTGAAVVSLAHTAKSDSEGGIRGSTGVAAACDLMVRIATPKKADKNERKLTFLGRWTVEDMRVRYEEDHYLLEGDVAFKSLDLLPTVYLYIEQNEACTTEEIRKAVRGDNNKIVAAVKELEAMGAVERARNGRGFSFYAVEGWSPDETGDGLVHRTDATWAEGEPRGEA
jgi:hypothetical protein